MNITMLGSGSYKSTLSFRLVKLAQELARTGYSVTAILPAADKYNNFTPDPSARIDGIRLRQPWQLKTQSAILNLIPYLMSATIQLLRSRSDIVYIYKPTPITIMGLLPKLFGRAPVILDLDDLGSEVMRRQGQSGLQIKLVAFCEKLALKYADAVVVASTYLETIVLEKYPSKEVLVLPNGVDVAQYETPVEAAPRKHVYYFGALDNLDLIDGLLRAMPLVLRQLPEARFTIIGGGSALPAAKKLATALGVSKAVSFTGWVDMFKVQDYTAFADIAVCYQPNTRSVRAASNMKVFQYMAMGGVSVVSDVGDLGTYVGQGSAGIVVTPDNAQALAAAIVGALKNPVRRVQLARNARCLAETDYAWSTLGGQLGAFIRPLAKEVVHA